MTRIASLVLCSCAMILAACSRGKAPINDTTPASPVGGGRPAASAPGTQSLAMLVGTWHGRTLAKDRDTTVGTWTFQMSGDSGTVTFPQGTKVPVREFRVVGDKILSKMGPWTSPTPESNGQPVTGDIVEQVHSDSVHGTVVSRLVAKPDSITAEVRIEGVRAKP